MANQTLGTDENIDYNSVSSSTNGIGVYTLNETKNNQFPVYFYRGNINNNYVLFNGYCWKIVRTTSSGGVKLVYYSSETDGTCPSSGTKLFSDSYSYSSDDNAYVGYMYGNINGTTYDEVHANINESKAKILNESWFENNFNNVTNYLEDTVWCNDRSLYSGTGIGTDSTIYGAYGRIMNKKKPIITCPQQNDSFTVSDTIGNGKLKYPIGMITADELRFAGGSFDGSTYAEHYYFSNFYSWIWNMSPYSYSDSARVGIKDTYGGSTSGRVTSYGTANTSTYSPSISLNNNVYVKSGNGTIEKPYVVELK